MDSSESSKTFIKVSYEETLCLSVRLFMSTFVPNSFFPGMQVEPCLKKKKIKFLFLHPNIQTSLTCSLIALMYGLAFYLQNLSISVLLESLQSFISTSGYTNVFLASYPLTKQFNAIFHTIINISALSVP